MKKYKVVPVSVLLKTADDNLLEVFPFSEYGKNRGELRSMKRQALSTSTGQWLKTDRENINLKSAHLGLKRRYQEAMKTIDTLIATNEAILEIKDTIETYTITPKKNTTSTEGTVVWLASDWHTDESVDELTVNGLNHFTPGIAQTRVDNFFRSGLRLTQILNQDVRIETIILALLGDFYTGHIHPDFMELTDTQPIKAVIRVQNMIASGIEYILKNSEYKLVIPCHSGNHARITDKTRFATEAGHSLEFYMYNFLSDYFKDNPRVKFIIPTGYHSYMDIYGVKIRFHHGHAIRYGGGVGGIYIPVNKAIAQWNKAFKVDLDCFGHFHQQRDGGNFLCNGSLIGYSPFALSIKADYEKPQQTLFLVDSKRGRTCRWPILLE